MGITHQPSVPPLVEYSVGRKKIVATGNLIKSFTYNTDLLAGADRHIVELITPEFQGLELADIHRDQFLSFRFGYSSGPMSEIIRHEMIDFDIDVSSDGSIITLSGGDRSIRINRGTRCKGYTGMKISDIVEAIARENELETDIEETVGAYTLRQIWKSDVRFIKENLLPRAISAKTGVGDYDVFIEGNKLHFHPPRFTEEVYKKYVLGGGEGTNRIGRFHLGFRGELSNAKGGLSSRVDGYNPFTKETLSFTAKNENTSKEVLGPKTILFNDVTRESRYYKHAAYNDYEVENEAKAKFAKAHRARYSGWMEVEGDPLIKSGDAISVSVPATDKANSIISGRYLVQGVTHTIKNKKFISIIHIVRNGILEGEETLQGTKRKNLVERDSRNIKQVVQEI